MTAHTPGPWYFQQVGVPGYYVMKGPNLHALPSTLANARLIAAAPDMLNALRETLATLNNPDADDYFDAARIESLIASAIRKATGEAP